MIEKTPPTLEKNSVRHAEGASRTRNTERRSRDNERAIQTLSLSLSRQPLFRYELCFANGNRAGDAEEFESSTKGRDRFEQENCCMENTQTVVNYENDQNGSPHGQAPVSHSAGCAMSLGIRSVRSESAGKESDTVRTSNSTSRSNSAPTFSFS